MPVDRRPRVADAHDAGAGRDGRASTATRSSIHDMKGYESDWRKHHTSSVTRDVWVYDVKAGEVHAADARSTARTAIPSSPRTANDFYYLSEQSGVVQRLQEHAGQSVASRPRSRISRSNPGPVPDARDDRHAVHSRTTASCTRSSRAATRRRSRFRSPRTAAARSRGSSRSTAASPRRSSRRTVRSSHSCSAARSSSAASTAES